MTGLGRAGAGQVVGARPLVLELGEFVVETQVDRVELVDQVRLLGRVL